jgi:hypothetical protein
MSLSSDVMRTPILIRWTYRRPVKTLAGLAMLVAASLVASAPVFAQAVVPPASSAPAKRPRSDAERPTQVVPAAPNEAQAAEGSPTQLAAERARKIVDMNAKVRAQILERARRTAALILARSRVTTAAISGRGGLGRIAPPSNIGRVTQVADLEADLTLDERDELDRASGQVPPDPLGLGAGPVREERRGVRTQASKDADAARRAASQGGRPGDASARPASGPSPETSPPAPPASTPKPPDATEPPPARYGDDPERPSERAPRRPR